jgi:hypothetical protein
VLCDTKGLRDHFFLLRKPTGTNSEGDLIIIRSEKIIGSIESELVLQGKLHDSSRNHLSLFIHRRTTGKGRVGLRGRGTFMTPIIALTRKAELKWMKGNRNWKKQR